MPGGVSPTDRLLRVESHAPLGASHFLLRLAAEDPLPFWEPGQFAMVSAGRPGDATDPLLRRPFSLYNLPDRDAGPSYAVEIFYKVFGRGTALLSEARRGDALSCLLPLGNGFSPRRPPGSRLLLVAGGIGSASLHPLALHERRAGREPLMMYGCRTAADLAGVEPSRAAGLEVLVTTDDGTAGDRGLVTERLDRFLAEEGPEAARRWVICACGPTPMMSATARVASRRGVACHVSLEAPMACGFGVCVGCVVGMREHASAPLRYSRICVDGPVFDAAGVVW